MKIAVVVPMHSYPEYRAEAIRSVVNQTHQPDWLICIPNGLPCEAKRSVLEGISRGLNGRRNGTVHIKHLEEGNIAAARNAGFEIASQYDCDFVIPLDEDDILHPEYIERMLLASTVLPECGILYPDWIKFGGWSGYVRTPEYSLRLLRERPFIISTSFISIKAWEAVRYDEELVRQGLRWEDYLFYLQAGSLGIEMARVGFPLVRVRGGGEGSIAANATVSEWLAYANTKLETALEWPRNSGSLLPANQT